MSNEEGAPTVKNIKIHFKCSDTKNINLSISRIIDDELKGSTTTDVNNNKKSLLIRHNFVVYRDRFVYIIFFQSGFVNATKIKNENEIEDAVEHFKKVFRVQSSIEESIIDNYQGSGSFYRKLALKELKVFLNLEIQSSAKSEMEVSYNPEHFPGLFLKIGKHGKIIIFSSGKFTIVGCKNESGFLQVFEKCKSLISTLTLE
jgi:TATA-box binding protein (TBP) (component of TFIID and TFIIIB)